MKKLFAGIIALLIPVTLLAQTAKEAQDLTQVMNRIKKVEKENQYLKKQTGSLQATVTSLTEQLATLNKKIAGSDSIVKSGQDTVSTYSARIAKTENEVARVSGAILIRTWIFLVILVLITGVIIYFQVAVRNRQSGDKAELMEKLKAQRDERERRISEVLGLLESAKAEQNEFQHTTRERITNLSGQIVTAEEQIRGELNNLILKREKENKESFTQIKESQDKLKEEFLLKLTALQKQLNDSFAGLQQELQRITPKKS